MKAIIVNSLEELNKTLSELKREELIAVTETREGENREYTVVCDDDAVQKRRGYR